MLKAFWKYPVTRVVKAFGIRNTSSKLHTWRVNGVHFGIRSSLVNPARDFSSSQENSHSNQEGSNIQLCESTLLCQDGTDIDEVPLAIIRQSAESKQQDDRRPFINLTTEEEEAFIQGFNNFHSPQEVLSVLHTVPSQEVTPVVALSILRKLFEVENNFVFQNDGKFWVIAPESSATDTFARIAIENRLIDILILGNNNSILLDALELLASDRQSIATNVIRFSDESEDENAIAENQIPIKSQVFEFSQYRSKLLDQVLIRTTKGLLTLEEICRAVCITGKISQLFPEEVENDFIDKLWSGISEKRDKIGKNNIAQVFRAVPYFKQSQRLVMRIAERKFLNLYWDMDTSTIAEICNALLIKDGFSRQSAQHYWGLASNRLLTNMSRIIHLNLHKLREDELVKITKAFHALDFCDHAFEKSISKYIKARCLKLSNPSSTLPVIMNYVKKNRIRSQNIFDSVVEYILTNFTNPTTRKGLSAIQISSLLIPLGYLDYQPKDRRFWEITELLLSEKFSQIPPNELIDCLLSCVYLKKYPLNFVNRIFSTYFLNRLNSTESNLGLLQHTRSKLKLLDIAFTLECGAKYPIPKLPRDFTAKGALIDGRIVRMRLLLHETLTRLYLTADHKLETSVVLPNLPFHPLYIVDVLMSPRVETPFQSLDEDNHDIPDNQDCTTYSPETTVSKGMHAVNGQVALHNRFSLLNRNTEYFIPIKQSSDYIAIIINVPEHFASDGKSLLGPEVMRIRHLKLLGFTVVNISYETLSALKSTPEALVQYVKEQIKV